MKICRLFSNLDPYRQLDPEQLAAISRTYRKTSIPAGAFLIRQGQPVSRIGFILSGTAKVTVYDHVGDELPCGHLNDGDLLFDIAVLTGDHASSNVVSLKASTWFLQSRESFLHTIDRYRPLKDYFYKKTAMGVRWGHEIFCKDFMPGFCDDRCATYRLPFLRKALQFIHGNYQQQITLEMVARETAMSKYHFSRLFKQHMGLSFKQYLNRQRIEAAKSLIATSGYNITEASFAVGFNDASYFSRVFREIEGGPPKRLLSLSDSTVSKAG
ncbi:helix-turn-helix domain-containing protein [uncultured Desulfosarcina sp.]|uniref:helix-turn-helix transcriptional regulator n=1 Tax=uncultured Desulfosarcina sp. TaxID=218289 RepID=UPI0029C95C00|nr:helix-turn-helix domain-containing protein [uncultured Desulfosarcina sp.]